MTAEHSEPPAQRTLAVSQGPSPADSAGGSSTLGTRRLEILRAAFGSEDWAGVRQLVDDAAASGTVELAELRFAILAAGKMHDFASGDALLQEATARSSGDPASLLDLASLAWDAGRISQAAEFLLAAHRTVPNDPRLWRGIAEHLQRRGDLEATLGALLRAGPTVARRLHTLSEMARVVGLPPVTEPLSDAGLPDALARPANPWLGRVILAILAKAPSPRQAPGKPRRIAVVGMHLGFGGAPQKAQRLACGLAATLAPDGGRVLYACPVDKSPDGRSGEMLKAMAVDIAIYGEASPIPFLPPAGTADLLAALAPGSRRERVLGLAARLSQWQPDVVHALGTNELLLEAALGAVLSGVPKIVLNPGMMRPERYAKRDQAIDQARIYREMFIAALRDEARFTIVNNSLVAAADYADWIGAAPGTIGLLQNGIDIPTETVTRAAAREAVGLEQDAQVVVVVGRLAHEKRPDVVLDVASRLAGVRDMIRVVFVGGGPLESWIAREIEHRGLGRWVRLAGYRYDVVPFYVAADACLLVSDAEGMPNAVLEAQALGLPVVATHAGGTREAMLPGTTGLIVDGMDAAALTAALVQALDPTWAGRAAPTARRRTREQFGMEAMVARASSHYGAEARDAAMHGARVALAISRASDLPFDASAALARGQQLAAQFLYGAAAGYARAVLRREPQNAAAWALWGCGLRGLGQWEKTRPRLLRHLAGQLAAGRVSLDRYRAIRVAIDLQRSAPEAPIPIGRHAGGVPFC